VNGTLSGKTFTGEGASRGASGAYVERKVISKRSVYYISPVPAEVAVPKQLFRAILERIRRRRPARDGAAMPPTTDETAGGRGGDGDGLHGLAVKASVKADLGVIVGRKRSDMPSVEQRKRLSISRSVIDSSKRPTAVVGRKSSGKS